MIKKTFKNSSLTTPLLALTFVSVLFGDVRAQVGFGNAAARAEVERGDAAEKQREYVKAAGHYRAAIGLDPYLVGAHKMFINNSISVALLNVKSDLSADQRRVQTKQARNVNTREMVALYEGWTRENPRNPAYQWGLGEIYRIDTDYQKWEQYMLKAISLDPKFVPAYQDLAIIAELRGDKNKRNEYLKKVAEYAPGDASSLYHYAQSLRDIDTDLYVKKMMEVANRFPNDERGAQALLQLAIHADKPMARIAYYERLRASFPPTRFGYSNAGMPDLFDLYSRTDPRKALALAEDMGRIEAQEHERTMWQERVAYQRNVVRARDLIDEKKYAEAISVLEMSAGQKPESVKFGGTISLQKAEAFAGAGQTERAYQELLRLVISEPTDAGLEMLGKVGANLRKTADHVSTDIRRSLEAKVKPAKDFSVARYGDEKQVSLADYRGKVVLLNFWFPSCVPCRVENPELQKILKKYGRDKFVILAINIRPEQDQFVLPYLRNNGFDFVPLRGNADFARTAFQVTDYPTNFLIDREGRVLSKLRAVRGEAIRTLELQIEMLLSNEDKK